MTRVFWLDWHDETPNAGVVLEDRGLVVRVRRSDNSHVRVFPEELMEIVWKQGEPWPPPLRKP